MANREPETGNEILKFQSSSNNNVNDNFSFRGGQSFIKVGAQVVSEAPQNATAAQVILTVGDSSITFSTLFKGSRSNGYIVRLLGSGPNESLAVVSQTESMTVIQLEIVDTIVQTTLEDLFSFVGSDSDPNLTYIGVSDSANNGEDFSGESVSPQGDDIELTFDDSAVDGTIGAAGDLLLVRGSSLWFALDDNGIHDAYWTQLGTD